MLKVMIVDDEIAVLNGLKNLFYWEDMGLCIIAEARNGQEAIEKYKIHFPDIVITDICMNGKDGLSVLIELKAINPNVQIIILTGYPNFEYAKTALENGAFSYLLKPLKMIELETALEKAKTKIYEHNTLVFEQFLYKLLNSSEINNDIINSLCKQYRVSLCNESYFMIAVHAKTNDYSNEFNVYERISEEIIKRISYQYNIFLCKIQKKCVAILAFCQNSRSQTNICQVMSQIQNSILEELGVSLVMGISQMFDDLCNIDTAWMQSMFAVSQKAIRGYGNMIYYSEKTNRITENATSVAVFISSEKTTEILEGIRNLNKDKVNRLIDDHFNSLENLEYVEINSLKDSISELAMQIVHFFAKDDTKSKIIFGKVPHPVTDIKNLEMLSQMRDYIKNLVQCIFDHPEVRIAEKFSKHVQDAQIYIMQHYSFSIGVESIADHLHLESAYLMRIFKKETGQTINSYLTNYRINIAIEIMKSKNYQIQEISSMVGYQDPKYFSKVFKKITGFLPSEYKG